MTPNRLTAPPDIHTDFAALLAGVGLNAADTGGRVSFTGADPIVPSRHRLGAIMAMGMMAPAVATQILYRMRGGSAQDLSVDLRQAVAHINPMYNFTPTAGGYPYYSPVATIGKALGFGIYPTKDDRWYLPTAVYPHMFRDWVALLQTGVDAESVARAISGWNAQDLEDAAAERGMVGTMIRTPEEWLAHPHGAYLSDVPLIEIIKIGDSAPELPLLADPARPLSGIKVATMTHVIAGPVAARTLAEQGAQVLDLARPDPEIDLILLDTHLGFRSTYSDLRQQRYLDQTRRLIDDADVVIENYRGRKIADFGLSAEAIAQSRPGIVYASVRGFGWDGPWSDRGGFDMDANCCTGYATLEGGDGPPKLPPTVILNDYLAGYLTALGVLAALKLRAERGGSYHVRTSLSRFSMWYSQLGVFDQSYVDEMTQHPDHQPVPPQTYDFTGAYGRQHRLAPGITYATTPGGWRIPDHPVVVPLGASEPTWLPPY
ncbi:L-carnitine dehydratase/bile acid-inducible protein F OS=Tsukamurella paurometabola (strain ATCC 8368/ DSM / CCUG 35730 / CIP 100753 / JCM 10117 / KCTC 9821 / NBRC 16120 / NCIMB 702349 / NCTC 13040) OX=521096 GN=Tpau_0034 PE=4 SV=1 [Tsukamurella paurometabola]|uniref:L-carnitine dehydratase/bile acid-inducible protein F n=1 Tax=Tsukamurella paurometabola (strain ATCC 8368 / DSM 20162 / CCUG 35730 / CIP 100753 / JCM 10117 / KCTC 9821 / NBRC 16120 / NCIMB 702349 / NCTC 13040) TaxID=521096 RepID=D5UPS0_TSUPD|nr:CoA transferase [Tsukamurella paurometabola]ADG76688.1 L-carnitine dehydratase/bile acid-inducible protein F [Tsukamurella paurometabola DSM 20162]SUP41226.1 Formyl-coenzyme A transferase [Tsukamurella paurometabola]